MRIGAALFLIAAGAILRFAVTAHLNGLNIQAVGVILMVIGILGLALELVWWSYRRRSTTVVTQQPRVDYVDPTVHRIERY